MNPSTLRRTLSTPHALGAQRARLGLNALAAALLAGGLLAASPAQSAGLASRYELTRIGLTGALYTAADGWQTSYVAAMNAAGQVAGTSTPFGVRSTSSDAWIYSGGTTQRIGLTGADYAGATDGRRDSTVAAMNAAGQVVGRSSRYSGDTYVGENAWLFSGGSTQRIGPTGAGYVATSTGRQDAWVVGINASGQAAGLAAIYNGDAELGHTAWFYSGGNTLDIGLGGYSFTQAGTGAQSSGATALNDAGHVAGWSHTYNGSEKTGQAAWLYKNGSTQLIGLTGAAYTNSSGGRYNDVQALNNAGQVLGYAARTDVPGGTAWLFDGSSTQAIGLSGAGYVRSNTGEQRSYGLALNDAGQAAGVSERFNGSSTAGHDAWIYSGGVAKQIGLTGGVFSSATGDHRVSNVVAMNSAGQVAGSSARFEGGSFFNQSAWVYDDDLDQTFELTFSVSHNGYAYSQIEYLGDDGLAVGEYDLFFGNTNMGSRAFAWTAQGGMVDLGGLVDGGLSMDWMSLGLAYRANGAGQIAGTGLLANGGSGAFLMTPVPTPVPEPEGYALLLAGLALLRVAGRRQRTTTAAAPASA